MPAPFVWINGFPGVGKLTTAEQLLRLISKSTLIDNHQLIDAVTLPRDHPEYNGQRERVRDEAYQKYVYPADDPEQLKKVVIFTDFYTTIPIGEKWSTAHKVAAEKAGRPFLPIYLQCSKEETLRRAVNPGRSKDGRTKLTDAGIIGDMMSRLSLFKFDTGIDIDVTNLQPEQVAEKIAEWVKTVESSS